MLNALGRNTDYRREAKMVGVRMKEVLRVRNKDTQQLMRT